MDRKKLLDTLSHVDPALIEAADIAPVRRKRWHRAALIAACLCVLLVGTAAAAEAVMEFKMTAPVRGSHVDAFGVEQTRTSFEIGAVWHTSPWTPCRTGSGT